MKKGLLILLSVLAFTVLAKADSATFSSPAGGEVWARGTAQTITYTLTQDVGQFQVALKRNGVFVGYISFHGYFYTAGVYNEPWQVGKVEAENGDTIWAPIGGGYTICAGCAGSGPPPYGYSNEFTIGLNFRELIKVKVIHYFPVPKPASCPACIILDLADVRQALLKLDETLTAGLFWQGKQVVDLGQIGKEKGFAARLQVKLEPGSFAAVKQGDTFELRLFLGRSQVHSLAVRLMPSGR